MEWALKFLKQKNSSVKKGTWLLRLSLYKKFEIWTWHSVNRKQTENDSYNKVEGLNF
jgi:hypothetical protein